MPSDKRKFVNPLTQPSTSSSTLPATETATLPDTFTYTSIKSAHRKRGAQAFEKTHERITLWLDKNLKEQFEVLADEQGVAKSSLLDEAIADLLAKYHLSTQAPRETRQSGEVEAPSPLPGNLVTLQAFADQHYVNQNEAERLRQRGMITAVKGNWTVGKQRVTVALDAKGRHSFWVQFHETTGFRACDDCPHK